MSLKNTLGCLFALLLVLANSPGRCEPLREQTSSEARSGILERMIVARGRVLLDLDLKRLSPIPSEKQEAKRSSSAFDVDANSFFTLLVFNDALRGPEPGSMALIPAGARPLPEPLASMAPLPTAHTQAVDPL